jgi:hypothetical protein
MEESKSMQKRIFTSRTHATLLLLAALGVSFVSSQVDAQQSSQLIQPIYRVAHEEAAEQPTERVARVNPPKTQLGFDLTQRPGEHPLMPALRVARDGLKKLDTEVHDYSAMLYKQERIDGVLHGQEVAYIKVRHQPFAVYMFFLSPFKGRECLYNSALDGAKGKLVALDCGWKRKIGPLEIDPEGRLAMNGQKYPIMKLGIRMLTEQLIEVATNDIQFGECDVTTKASKINGRPVTLIEVVHPVSRPGTFRFYKAEVFIDNELQVPIRYAAYMWPDKPGDPPLLEESYTYINLEVNNNFPAVTFDKENPEIFKN